MGGNSNQWAGPGVEPGRPREGWGPPPANKAGWQGAGGVGVPHGQQPPRGPPQWESDSPTMGRRPFDDGTSIWGGNSKAGLAGPPGGESLYCTDGVASWPLEPRQHRAALLASQIRGQPAAQQFTAQPVAAVTSPPPRNSEFNIEDMALPMFRHETTGSGLF